MQEAIGHYQRLLEDQVRVLGADHPDSLRTRNNLAYLLGRAGEVQEAVGQFGRLLQDQVRVLGPDHPDSRTARNNLAHWREMVNHPRGN